MKINQIHLENIRSYEEQTVEFPEGTILIHGENGTGKTSLLMGLFGGLFLSNITNVGNNNFNLSDLVRRGADKGHVGLDFEVDGDEYAVEWTMPGEDSGSQSSATLTSPALSEPISGITNVQREVTALIGMDEDDFSSSAYVKQGEIDRLIEANDRGAMIDSLLGLDQIEKYIERAKLGRRGARRAYERCQERRRGQEENLDTYDYDEDGYVSEIQRLADEIDEAKATVKRYQDHIDDKLTPTLNRITDALERYDTLSAQLSTKETQIDRAESERTETRRSKQESKDQIDQYKAQIADISAEINTLKDKVEYDLSSAESTANALDAVREDLLSAQEEKNICKNGYNNAKGDLVDARTDVGDIAADLDEARDDKSAMAEAIEEAEYTVEAHEADLREQLRDLAGTLADFEVETNFGGDDPETEGDVDLAVATDALAPLVRERIPERQETLTDEIDELTGEIGRLETKAEQFSEDVDELRELGKAGECLKCGQNVNESHVEDEIAEAEHERENIEAAITEQKDKKKRLQRLSGQLSGIRNTINDMIDFRDDTLAEAREKVEDLREARADLRKEIDDLEDEKADLEATIDDLETTVSDHKEAFETAQEAMEAVADTREMVKDIDEKYDTIDEHQTKIEQKQQSITHADETIERLDGRLEMLRDKREEIKNKLGDLDADELKERKTAFENEIETWEGNRDETQNRVEDLRDEYARVDTTLDSLRDLKENIAELERRERWTDSVRADLEQILSIYNEVQSDLRETYLDYLNEYANDIFKEIYKNSSYQQVIITEEHDETYNTYDYDIQLLRDDGTTEACRRKSVIAPTAKGTNSPVRNVGDSIECGVNRPVAAGGRKRSGISHTG